MEKKITMNHNDKKIEYILYDTPPCRPFLNINGFYLRLSNIPSGDIRINGLYPYMQRNSIYITNKDGLLRKIATKNGMEEWNYNAGKNINSVFSQNTNVFITNKENIREINDNKQLLKTLNIQSDKAISDGEDFYTIKGTKLAKVTANGQEQFSYNLDANIKDIATDKVGNIYVATDKDVRKLAKKVIGDKDSKNLIRNSNFQNGLDGWEKWSNTNTNIENGVCLVQPIINSPCGIITSRFNVEKGKQYTVSFDACSYYNTSVLDYNYIMYCTGGNVPINGININAGDTVIRRYSLTFTAPETKSIAIMLGKKGKQYNNDGFKITNIQLEEGDKTTPYKLNILDYVNIGEWKYSINSNSIALDSENNLYISTSKNIKKLNIQGQKIDALDIQADNIALDLEDNLYVSKDKSVEKLDKKMIITKESKNLLRDTEGVFTTSTDGYTIKTYNIPQNLVGKTITVSCKARISKQGKDTQPYMAIYDSSWKTVYNAFSKKDTTEWQDLVVTHKIDTDKPLYLGFWNYPNGNGGCVQIKDIQLEIGEKATQYESNFRDRDDGNLLINSEFENNNLTNFSYVNDCAINISNEKSYKGKNSLKVTFKDVKTSASGYAIAYKWKTNQTYTLSGYIYSMQDITLDIRALYKEWETLGDKYINLKANQWNYFSYTFTTKDTRGNILILLANSKNYCDLYLDEVQLEIGDKATPYKPNLNDYIRQGEWKHIDNSEINNIAIG